MLPESTCKSCRAAIYWVQTRDGKQMPLDTVPVTDGNIVLRDGRAHYVTMFDDVSTEATFKSHFATCPDRDQWRKKGSGNERRNRR